MGQARAAGIVEMIGTLPMLGPMFEDTSGRGDIHLSISWSAVTLAGTVLVLVGLAAALVPAIRAARLDPIQAIRNE